MSNKTHHQKYIQFQDVLRLNQKDIDKHVDIRQKTMLFSKEDISIGYVQDTLTNTYGTNLKKLFSKLHPIGSKNFNKSDIFLISGTIYQDEKKSHKGALHAFENNLLDKEVVFFEQGFLASSHSWAHSFQEKDPKYACLGYVYDDISYYYMADYPNRLIHKLNSTESLTSEDLNRAKSLIDTIVKNKISKYNAQPIYSPTMSEGYNHRVLVCDQAYADASTIYGKIDDEGFEKMLMAAIEENPESEIIVKTHPDTSWRKDRSGYYSHLESRGRVRVLKDPINPYSLFEHIDKVYVGTSQIGLEALFAGKEVVCFGVPFYAGWGFTYDRQKIAYRDRKRSLEEVFYYFYIWYTIYHRPDMPAPCQIEDVLEHILENRPVQDINTHSQVNKPKVSIVIPVYEVEKYIEECIKSVQSQTLQEIEIITINDKSPDNSQAIIDRLAAEDKRIKPIVLKENIGQGFARNKGIQKVKGDYIYFIDSDDFFVNKNVLEIAYNEAANNDLDMLKVRKAYEYLQNSKDEYVGRRVDKAEEQFFKNIKNTDILKSPELLHARHFWLFLYKKEFIARNDIKFITTQWEERPFVLKALLKANKITSLAIDALAYRVRVDSTARRDKNNSDYLQQIKNFEFIVGFFKELKAYEQQSKYHYHYRFTISQYINHLFAGTYIIIKSGNTKDSDYEFFNKVGNLLNQVEFTADRLIIDPVVVNNVKFNEWYYHLLVSSLVNGEYKILANILDGKNITLDRFFKYIGVTSKTRCNDDVIKYINKYYKNDKIAISKPMKTKETKNIRVVVHIGSTKTGSTYLQHLMEENRPELLKHGVWYPERGLSFQKNRPHKQAGHAKFAAAAVHNNKNLLNYIKSGIELIPNMHTIVLSSEAFFLNEKSVNLVSYFKDFDVSMIVYLRRQDDWANSQYCEFVSGGAYGYISDTMEEWLEDEKTKERLDYYRLIKRWQEYLPKEKIIVRPYEKEQFVEGDLVKDFAKATGLSILAELPKLSNKQKNDNNFTAEHVKILRHFNSLPFEDKSQYLEFIEACNSVVKPGSKKEKVNVLNSDLREKLLQKQHSGNQKLAQEYLAQEELFLNKTIPTQTSNADDISVQTIEKFFEYYSKYSGIKNGDGQTQYNKSKQRKPSSKKFTLSVSTSDFLYQKYKQSVLFEHLPKIKHTKVGKVLLKVKHNILDWR